MTATEQAAGPLSRERRAELLAAAGRGELEELAEQTLADTDASPVVLAGPEVGMIMLQVREPVAAERFYLGEVLAARAEIELDGRRGWCLRLGDDRRAALAAAVLDAAAETGEPHRGRVEALCHTVAARQAAAERAERAELAATRVHFEELDA